MGHQEMCTPGERRACERKVARKHMGRQEIFCLTGERRDCKHVRRNCKAVGRLPGAPAVLPSAITADCQTASEGHTAGKRAALAPLASDFGGVAYSWCE